MEKRRFRFLKKLSEGTFGKVYLAEIITEKNFSKVVAIKLLHAKWADHDEIIKRSRDEARVLGRLQNRHIIKVEGLISIGGKCAIIMEYLNGVDLKTLINFCAKNKTQIPRKVIFEVIADVASALDAAFNKRPMQGGDPLRLIHRDIKPSNIMVTIEADVKVLDFGTAQAKFEDREAETQALAFGSAAYMSPERFLGDEDRLSGDVYALGVTLFELLYQGRYGKANVRSEVFYEEQERRFAKLDLSAMSDDVAERVKTLLRGMLRWEESERPSLAHILQETEELAQLVNDGSLKLFCRDVVEDCKKSLEDPNAKRDPLENEVLFEDGSEDSDNFSEPLDSGDPDIRSSMSFPPQINIASVDRDNNIYSEATIEVPIPTSSSNRDDFSSANNTQSSGNQDARTNPRQNNQQKSSTGIILVCGLGLLLLGGGVGLWLIQPSETLESKNSTVEAPILETLPSGKGALKKDLGVKTETQVTLKIKSKRKVLVSLKHKGLDYDWNGSGSVVLTGVPRGALKIKTSSIGTKDLRDRIPIQEGKQCIYTLDFDAGESKWEASCS
jgi:serine/threonine protein kinase